MGEVIPYFPFFGVPLFAGVMGLLMLPFGLLQVNYAWKLHTQNFNEFERVIIISIIMIVLSIVAASLSGLFALGGVKRLYKILRMKSGV